MRTPDLLDALAGHIDVEAPEGMILGWRSIRPDMRSKGVWGFLTSTPGWGWAVVVVVAAVVVWLHPEWADQ